MIHNIIKKIQEKLSYAKIICLETIMFRPSRVRFLLYLCFYMSYYFFNTVIFLEGTETIKDPEENSQKFGWQGALFFGASILIMLASQASTFGGGGGDDAVLASAVDSLASWISEYFQSSKEISSAVPDLPEVVPEEGKEVALTPVETVSLEDVRLALTTLENDFAYMTDTEICLENCLNYLTKVEEFIDASEKDGLQVSIDFINQHADMLDWILEYFEKSSSKEVVFRAVSQVAEKLINK